MSTGAGKCIASEDALCSVSPAPPPIPYLLLKSLRPGKEIYGRQQKSVREAVEVLVIVKKSFPETCRPTNGRQTTDRLEESGRK